MDAGTKVVYGTQASVRKFLPEVAIRVSLKAKDTLHGDSSTFIWTGLAPVLVPAAHCLPQAG